MLLLLNWASSVDSFYSWKICKLSCKKLWVYQSLSWKLQSKEERWGLNPHYAKAITVASTTHNSHFANGFASPLNHRFLKRQQAAQTSNLLVIGLKSWGLFWIEFGHPLFTFLYFQKAWQPKLHPTKATLPTTVHG